MWFDTWSDLLRILLVGAVTYASLIAVLRLAGKRTLSQFNAFDFVVTVALGSTVATILLSSRVAFAEGALAVLLLVGLQFAVALLSSRVPRVRTLFASTPTLLAWQGEVRDDALRRMRLSRAELEQAVRGSGAGDMSNVAAAVLESNGMISVITVQQYGDGSALGELAPDRVTGPAAKR